jgi:hypothetical protein
MTAVHGLHDCVLPFPQSTGPRVSITDVACILIWEK